MNTIAVQRLDREACLRSLVDFWQAETRIEETPRGLTVALPMLYPDGWQVVADLEQLTPHEVKLSDIRNGNPEMLRAMVYDPDQQEWNDTALSIGRSVCDIFCPYFDSAALGDALGRVA